MTWYIAYYGGWRDGDSVHHIGSSFDRKEIIAEAKKVAMDTKKTVTIMGEKGMKLFFYHVKPDGTFVVDALE